MAEPTDAEIVAVMRDGYNCRYNDEQDHVDFARAVLAAWGTPPAVAGEPVAYLHKHKHSGMVELSLRRMADNDFNHARWECSPLYAAPATPQPTQAQAGAVPLTRERVKAILTECGYDGASAQHRADFINGLRHGEAAHGIKGGQHGADT